MSKQKKLKNKNKSIKTKQNRFQFLLFLLQKEQRFDWLILATVSLFGYFLMKYCYPFPVAGYLDTSTYVDHAVKNIFSYYRPFGYSFFLQILHSISSSIYFVVIAQFLLYFASTAVFAFTVKYFFPPNRKIIWISALLFLSFSPFAFYLAYSIMSDLIFSVSIYFLLAGFIFIVMKKSWTGLILFTVALSCSLPIRYSAMIFPFVLIPFFLLSKGFIKYVATAISITAFIVFYLATTNSMLKTTGFNQFSTGFDGWQLLNNALHFFPYIDLKPEEIEDAELRQFHKYLLLHKDVIRKEVATGKTNQYNGTTTRFMWEEDLPQKAYLHEQVAKQKRHYGQLWITLGSGLYSDYGRYLILNYPFKFMQYYYLPNCVNIFSPSTTGIMQKYLEIDSTFKSTINWYKVPQDKAFQENNLKARNDIYGAFLTKTITVTHTLIWILIGIVTVTGIINRKQINFTREEKLGFWGIFAFGVIYYSSNVFASPIELRYWLPMASVQFAFLYIILNKLNKSNNQIINYNNQTTNYNNRIKTKLKTNKIKNKKTPIFAIFFVIL